MFLIIDRHDMGVWAARPLAFRLNARVGGEQSPLAVVYLCLRPAGSRFVDRIAMGTSKLHHEGNRCGSSPDHSDAFVAKPGEGPDQEV